MTVDTLEWVLAHLDRASAAGCSGLDFAVIRLLKPNVVRPLLQAYLAQGTWDYSRRVDGRADGALYHRETHALLIYVRGIALDKDGTGYEAGRAVTNLRPIGIGECLRRVAGRCQLLQLEKSVGVHLSRNGQFGCGFRNGTSTVYHVVSKALDALVASNTPGASAETDAKNAFGSIFRAAIQRGIIKHAPSLLPTFDFLYGPNAEGKCFFFQPGRSSPVGSCGIPDGVQQGDVFGPLFFSLGLDELLTAVRERMRNLPVDDTMIGQRVLITGSTPAARLIDSNSVVPLDSTMVLSLVSAPSYVSLDRPGRDLANDPPPRVTVRVGDESSGFLITVDWLSVILRAEVLLACYLDDIHLVGEAFLLRPFTLALREFGPRIGLRFDSPSKNYAYCPRVFGSALAALLPDAVFVGTDTPGDTHKAKLEYGAAQLDRQSSRLLITTIGVPKLMGAPLRTLCADGELLADIEWIQAQALAGSRQVASKFVHLGLDAVDAVATAQLGPDVYGALMDNSARLPASEPQIQAFIARYSLGTRLGCLTNALPSSLVSTALIDVDLLLAATVAGCAGESSLDKLSVAQIRRSTLAARYSGVLPGAAVTTPAGHICAVGAVEKFLIDLGSSLKFQGVEPCVLGAIRQRLAQREHNQERGILTPLERELLADVERVNAAHADPAVRNLARSGSRGGVAGGGAAAAHEVGGISATSASVSAALMANGLSAEGAAASIARFLAPVGQDRPPQVVLASVSRGSEGAVQAPRPLVTFGDLAAVSGKSRQLGEGLWATEFLAAYATATDKERIRMSEGRLKGSGLVFMAVPSTRAFNLGEATYRRALTEFMGISNLTLPHTHHCCAGAVRTLGEDSIGHIGTCSMGGRNFGPHDALKDALTHFVVHNGIAQVCVTEATVIGPHGTLDTDITYWDNQTLQQVVVEVSVVSLGSASSVNRSSRAGLEAAEEMLKARETEKRNQLDRIRDDEGINKITRIPFVVSSCGAFGPSASSFMKHVYARARSSGKWIMALGQPDMQSTWNTNFASTYWDMRLSVACAAMDAYCQNRIIIRDHTLNLPTTGRQPHPDPNFAPYERPKFGASSGA